MVFFHLIFTMIMFAYAMLQYWSKDENENAGHIWMVGAILHANTAPM